MAVKDPKTKDPNVPFSKQGSEVYRDEKPSPFSIESLRSGATSSRIIKGFLIFSGLIMGGGFIIGAINPPGAVNRPGAPPDPNSLVARVGQQSVRRAQLDDAMQGTMQFKQYTGQQATVASYFEDKKGALKRLTDNAANIEAARAAGISVSEQEIDKKIDEIISEQLKPEPGKSEATVRRALESQFGSVAAARTELRTRLNREAVANQLLVEKLEKQVKDANRTTEADYKKSVTRLDLSQIVIRPQTPQTASLSAPAPNDDKSRVAAQNEAAKIFAALKANPTLANFRATAKKVSDDEATKKSGGALGLKLPSEVFGDPSFSQALRRASGNLVGPLSDSSGAQTIFFIAARKEELPKDYAKNKKSLLEAFETQSDNDAWTQKQEEYRKAIEPEITDPTLAVYNRLTDPAFFTRTTDEQKRIREESLSDLESGARPADEMANAALHFQIANLHRDLGQKPQQLTALKEAVQLAPRDVDLRLDYARTLRDGGQPKVALEQLQTASKTLTDNPPSPSMFGGPDPSAAKRAQIAAEFELLKQPALARAERAKIPPPPPAGASGLPGGFQMR